MWNIKCYVSERGKCDIQERYDQATDDVKAALEVELDYLTVRERAEWRRPHAAKLSRCEEFRDFFELRFFADRVQQRPIGFFGPGMNEFTILVWATEKGNELLPREWCSIANRKRLQIIAGTARAEKLKLDGEEK